jgi:mevalonate kinase
MFKELFEPHISSLIAGLITGFIGWFFGRKKATVDVEGVQIEKYDKGLIYYQKMVDDLGNRLEKAIAALQRSEVEKQEVITNLHELERKVEILTDELKKYKQLTGKIK